MNDKRFNAIYACMVTADDLNKRLDHAMRNNVEDDDTLNFDADFSAAPASATSSMDIDEVFDAIFDGTFGECDDVMMDEFEYREYMD